MKTCFVIYIFLSLVISLFDSVSSIPDLLPISFRNKNKMCQQIIDSNNWQCECKIESGGNQGMALYCGGSRLIVDIDEMLEEFSNQSQKDLTDYSLRYLEIPDNRLTKIPLNVLLFKELEHLDLTNNKLEEIKFSYLPDLLRLDVVILANNRLHSLRKGAFKFKAPLKLLNLRDNQLSLIEPGAIQVQSFANDSVIQLNSNNLTRFELNVFKPILQQMVEYSNATIILNNNPINCKSDPCHLAWLVRDNRHLLKVVRGGTCSNYTRIENLNPQTICPSENTIKPEPRSIIREVNIMENSSGRRNCHSIHLFWLLMLIRTALHFCSP